MTARIYEGLGRLSSAAKRYEDALGDAEGSANIWIIASAVQKVGENALRLGKYREAKERFGRLQDIGRQLGSPQFLGDAILGVSRADIGLRLMPKRLPGALDHFRKVKAISGEALCLTLLGEGELNMAKYEDALKMFEQARAAFEKIGDVAGVGNSMVRMGHAYRERGEYEEAEKKYQEAEAIYRNNRLDGGVITCLRARGDLYKRQRKFDEAQKQYGEALNFARDAKDAQAEANLLLGLGDLYIDTKQ